MKNILLEIDENTFVVSDTHFNHISILDFEPSRYKNMQENGLGLYVKDDIEGLNIAHTEWIVKNWNSVVGKDDIIIHMGDLAWNGHREILPRLNGRKILVLGNHDKKGPNTYEDFEYIVRGAIKIEDDRIYINDSDDKLFSSLEMVLNNNKFLFSHYPATVLELRYKFDEDKRRFETPTNDRILKLIDIAKYGKIDYNIHGHTHSVSYNKSDNGWNFLNCSLEVIGFKPIKIKDLL